MKKLLFVIMFLVLGASIPSFADNLLAPHGDQSSYSGPVYSAFARIVNIDQTPLLTNDNFVQVPLITSTHNYGGLVNTESNSTGGFNVKINETGIYTINIYLNFGNNSNGQRGFQITCNDGQLWKQYYNAVGGGLPTIITATYTLQLAEGDVLRLLAYQNSGSDLPMGRWNQMSVTKIGAVKPDNQN